MAGLLPAPGTVQFSFLTDTSHLCLTMLRDPSCRLPKFFIIFASVSWSCNHSAQFVSSQLARDRKFMGVLGDWSRCTRGCVQNLHQLEWKWNASVV